MKHSNSWRFTAYGSLFLILFSTTAHSQRIISIKEAIELSIKNSGQLKSSKAKVAEAVAFTREALDRKLPEASVSGSHIRLNSPNVDLKVRSNNGGGAGYETTGDVSSATYGILNVSLPLYSGKRIRYGIESARYLEQAAKLDADNDQEAVIINTIDAFDNLYKSRAAVQLVNESLLGAQERVKQFMSLEKNGLLARNDLLKAELQESNTSLSLLDAENNRKLANINMNLILGLPDSTELLPDSSSFVPGDLKNLEEYLQVALQGRKDIAALGYRKKAAITEVKSINGEKYPIIALTGGYVGLTVPNLLTVTNAVNIGVGVQYSIASLWKNKAKVAQAKARETQIIASEGILNDAVRLRVNQSYQNFLLSQKKIEVYQKAVAQAEENYKIVRNKYNNTLATTTDLLDADVAQLQSRLNYAFSKSDAWVAYNKLLQTAGLLSTETQNLK